MRSTMMACLLAGVAALTGCTAYAVGPLLDDFPSPRVDFERHVDELREYLERTQLPGREPGDVEYNLPFEISAAAGVDYRGRYLLIHGLNDSPAVWTDVAPALARRGHDVRAILLPGHGNTPEAQLDIIEDNPTKYNSLPINALGQYYRASRHLARSWDGRRLSMPVLMVQSFDDSVVDVDAVRRTFAERFTSSRARLVLYGEADDATGPREIVRPSRYPRHRILNQSHQGLMISPDNPMFGIGGTQLVCNGNEWEVFSACLYYARGPHWHGAEGTASPDGVPVARTTFNPDFAHLMREHDAVFAGTPDEP